MSIRAPYAVRYCIHSAAASTDERPGGVFTTARAGTIACSP